MPESSQPPSRTSSLPSHWPSIELENFILHSLQLVRFCRAIWLDKRFLPFNCTIPFDACHCHQFWSHTYSPIDQKRLTTLYDSIVLSAWQLTPLWILRGLRRLLQF